MYLTQAVATHADRTYNNNQRDIFFILRRKKTTNILILDGLLYFFFRLLPCSHQNACFPDEQTTSNIPQFKLLPSQWQTLINAAECQENAGTRRNCKSAWMECSIRGPLTIAADTFTLILRKKELPLGQTDVFRYLL